MSDWPEKINHWVACARLTSECSSVVHADLLEKAAVHIASIESLLEAAKKRIAELDHDAILPGVMRCADCGFTVNRVWLNFGNGTVTAGSNETAPCPNGCGPLHPDTWKRSREELCAQFNAADAALSAANEKLRQPVVLPDDGLEDCMDMWPDNWRNDFDTGYNFGLWRCEKNIKAAGFAVEGGK